MLKYALLTILMISGAGPIWSMDCNGKGLATGDTVSRVLKNCGKAAFTEKWKIEEKTTSSYILVIGNFIDKRLLSEKSSQIILEEWIYNFGNTRFIYILQFHNGKLANIQTGNYGYKIITDKNQPPSHDKRIVSLGQTKFDVLMLYGKPDLNEEIMEKISDNSAIIPVREQRRAHSNQNMESIVIEERIIKYKKIDKWFYNLGKSRLSQWLTFINGRVTNIDSSEYGSD